LVSERRDSAARPQARAGAQHEEGSDRVIVSGHRGARQEAPENTVAGLLHARSVGLDRVEIDVRLSADGEVVVIHDPAVDRCTDGTGAVADLTLARLRELDAAAHFDSWSTRCPIPTLDEALAATEPFAMTEIEVKADDAARLDAVVRLVADRVAAHGASDRVLITSFDLDALRLARRYAPQLRRSLIGAWISTEPLTAAVELGCIQASVNRETCSASVVAQLRQAGLMVVGWVCNQPAEVDLVARWKVDVVATDRPSAILPYVASLERGAQ